jgi:ribosomal-protein-alanine N-acetyltransferase
MIDAERCLRTKRLVLEPLVVAHAPELFKPLRDERLYRYYAGQPPESIEELRVRFALLAKRQSPDGTEKWLNWVVRLRDGSIVGRMQATIRSNHTLIGYDIFVPYWRRGYGKEAVRAMLEFLEIECAVKVVRAIVDSENVASIRLLESLGFTRAWTGKSDDLPGRTDHCYERAPR